METKSLRLNILVCLFVININLIAQPKNFIDIRDVKLNNVSLENARYEQINFGTVKNDSSWILELEDYTRNYHMTSFDSIMVLSFITSSNNKYSDWIKVFGNSHKLNILNTYYSINDSISKFKTTFPIVIEDYQKYTIKNKSDKSTIYIGVPLRIQTKDGDYFFGSMKFGIWKGIVKEFLIDMRPDGEFD